MDHTLFALRLEKIESFLMENSSNTQNSSIKKTVKSEKIIQKKYLSPKPRPRLRKDSGSSSSSSLSKIQKSIDYNMLVKKLETSRLNNLNKTEITKQIIDKSKPSKKMMKREHQKIKDGDDDKPVESKN